MIPGKVVLRLDRRMIPEESPDAVEASLRQLIANTVQAMPGMRVEVHRLLLARALQPSTGQSPLENSLREHAIDVFGEDVPACGTPLYTDARLYAEQGIPAAL